MAATNLIDYADISDVAGTPDLGNLLKHVYADWDIQGLVNLTTPLWPKVAKRGSATLGGNGFYFPVRTRSAEGHAYIAETADLPTAGISEVRQAVVQPKIQVGTVELTGLARAISSGSAMAFASAFDENVTATMQSMMAYREGALFRSGDGLLATITSVAGAPTYVVDDVGFLREGMQVEVVDDTDDITILGPSAGVITNVDWAARSFTSSVTFTGAAASDRVYLRHTQTTGVAVQSNEIAGLGASVSTAPTSGVYLGLDRASFPNWRNSAINVAGFLDEDAVLRIRSRISQESGVTVQNMAADFAALCHQTQVDILFKLAIPKIRYSGNDKFDLGYSDTVYFGNIPFLTSYQCPTTRAYIGDWSYHKELIVPGGELGIDSDYNGSSLKWLDRKDAGIVVIKGYHNLALTKPTCFGVLSGLTDATR